MLHKPQQEKNSGLKLISSLLHHLPNVLVSLLWKKKKHAKDGFGDFSTGRLAEDKLVKVRDQLRSANQLGLL